MGDIVEQKIFKKIYILPATRSITTITTLGAKTYSIRVYEFAKWCNIEKVCDRH